MSSNTNTDDETEQCEFCHEDVEEPSHVVVNGRIYVDDETTCSECGYSDEELLAWVREHQPGSLAMVEDRLGEDGR